MHNQVQNNQPFRVVYDMQKNRYYRVNKLTGEIEPSYKTGKTPAKFDSNITGINYLARLKLSNLRMIQQSVTEPNQSKEDNSRKSDVSETNKYSNSINLTAIVTDSNQSRISEQRQISKLSHTRKRKEQMRVEFNTIDSAHQKFRPKAKTIENDFINLPRLQKRNSETRFQARQTSINQLVSPSKIKSVRKTEPNADISFLSSKIKQNPKDYSFVNSMNKLAIMTGESSISQSRMQFEKFDNKLKKYSEIEESKLTQNHFQPLSNDQKSQKLHKFVQKSLLASVLDDSHLTLDQTNNQLNLSRFNQASRQRKTITRANVQKALDKLSKQKASLLLLQKKCQPHKSHPFQPNLSPIKKQSEPLIKAINLLEIQQQQKLKQQLQQEKQTFLSFYPTYVFKDNPRLVKEQKDRKINLKKLEHLYLENNEKKFGKIYHSESKDNLNEKSP